MMGGPHGVKPRKTWQYFCGWHLPLFPDLDSAKKSFNVDPAALQCRLTSTLVNIRDDVDLKDIVKLFKPAGVSPLAIAGLYRCRDYDLDPTQTVIRILWAGKSFEPELAVSNFSRKGLTGRLIGTGNLQSDINLI